MEGPSFFPGQKINVKDRGYVNDFNSTPICVMVIKIIQKKNINTCRCPKEHLQGGQSFHKNWLGMLPTS